jgi:hypothetical protein
MPDPEKIQDTQSGEPVRLKPISLHPLSLEDAMSAFMKADPEKVQERLKKKGIVRDKKK